MSTAIPTIEQLEQIIIPRLSRGKKRAPMHVLRELEDTDLPGLLSHSSPEGHAQPPMKKLRHSHHQLAMCLAAGAKHHRASEITGYSPGTITVLLADPMFNELVEHYRTQKSEEFADFQRQVASLGLSFVDELRERLEEAPESFSVKELIDGAEKFLDRTIMPSKAAARGAPAGGPSVFRVEFVEAQPRALTIEATGPTEVLFIEGAEDEDEG